MDRLIYNEATQTIVARIKNCEGTCSGTPFVMIEDTPENIDRLIDELGLLTPAEGAS